MFLSPLSDFKREAASMYKESDLSKKGMYQVEYIVWYVGYANFYGLTFVVFIKY